MKGEIHHIEIYVNNINQTKDFWTWLLSELGYSIFQEWPQGFSFKLNQTYIVFVQVEDKYLIHAYHRKHPGLNHIAFDGGNKDFVDEITKKLKIRNIPILYLDKHPFAGGSDYYAVFFEDPNRIKIEIVSN